MIYVIVPEQPARTSIKLMIVQVKIQFKVNMIKVFEQTINLFKRFK